MKTADTSLSLNVSDIQHFSTGDGPGIRTTVFLKGCDLRCPWCHNPETWKSERQVLRYESADTEAVYGKQMTVEDVIGEVSADIDFYTESGGGMTVSGGECMLQTEGLAALLAAAKERGIHTAVDTAGCVGYSAFEAVNRYTDLYLFDIKTASAQNYRLIGGDLDTVTENAKSLVCAGKDIIIRIPLIPDFNTAEASCEQLASLISGIGAKKVELLPFHRLGAGKYKALGWKYPYEATEPMSADFAKSRLRFFASCGLDAAVRI